jgi:hypothetical protein
MEPDLHYGKRLHDRFAATPFEDRDGPWQSRQYREIAIS